MQRKNYTGRVRTVADVEAAAKSLAEATESLRVRNLELAAYLASSGPSGPSDAIARVANAPEMGLDDATARAKRYWDKLESRRSSVPPAKHENDGKEKNEGRSSQPSSSSRE